MCIVAEQWGSSTGTSFYIGRGIECYSMWGRGSGAQRMRDERREFGGRAWGGRNNKWGTPRLTSRRDDL